MNSEAVTAEERPADALAGGFGGQVNPAGP